MRTSFLRILPVAAVALTLAILAGCGGGNGSASAPATHFVSMGTGGQTGVYFLTGQNLAKYLNDQQDTYHVNCTVSTSDGSVFNTKALLRDEIEFGIVQSDIQYQAVKGLGEWKADGPQTRLRAVFAIHPELVTLVAATDAGITTIADLKGKRVNLGAPGSGDRVNAIAALGTAGIDADTDVAAQSLPAKQAPGLLKDGRLDAFFYTVGHPAGAITEAMTGGVNSRAVRFVPIPNVDDLIARNPYYIKAAIPISFYPGTDNKEDVPTFAVKATLMTTKDVPDDVVYAMTKELLAHFDDFKKLHPAYASLTRESLLVGLSAPLHPGAEKAFREAGLIK